MEPHPSSERLVVQNVKAKNSIQIVKSYIKGKKSIKMVNYTNSVLL